MTCENRRFVRRQTRSRRKDCSSSVRIAGPDEENRIKLKPCSSSVRIAGPDDNKIKLNPFFSSDGITGPDEENRIKLQKPCSSSDGIALTTFRQEGVNNNVPQFL